MAVVNGERVLSEPACCCDALHLTEREIEVLCVLASGKTSQEVAKVLQLSRRTVDAHVIAMRRKAAVHNRGELLALAVAYGMIDMTAAPPRWTGRSCLPLPRGAPRLNARMTA
jgi:DNA-binding CsgD family transcriptional regulator